MIQSIGNFLALWLQSSLQARFFLKTSDHIFHTSFQLWTVSASRFVEVNCVSVCLSSDNAGSVAAKSFWMSAHVHTCLAHVCVSGLFAIVLSLGFSRPPPPIITTLSLVLVLFSFCFSLSPSLLLFLFYLGSSLALAVSLVSAAEWSRPERSCGVYRRESERRPVTCATSSSACTVSE